MLYWIVTINKPLIISEAKQIYAAKYAAKIPEHGGCLFWAASFNKAAANNGLDAIIQAGSAQFQFQADDGVCNTHFAYMFDKTEAIKWMQKGILPEMHVWSYLRTTKEIVDLSLKYQAAQAKKLCGYDWDPKFALPDYIWASPDELKDERIIYRADMAACMLALAYLKDFQSKNK